MGTVPRTSRIRFHPIAGVLFAAVAGSSLACTQNSNDTLVQLRDAADIAIVKIKTLGPGSCSTTATGFFISPAGHILTAGHVVPQHCDDSTSIKVYWSKEPRSSKLLGPFEAKVTSRSSLDVLVLKLNDSPDDVRQFLQRRSAALDPSALKNSCVLLSSQYYEQKDTYSTFAEIASVSLDGDARWALSGDGFNPSRSGSPVITGNGEVAAIFVGKPSDPNDRQGVISSRAYVQPLAGIPKAEIDLDELRASPGQLNQFLTLNASTAGKAQRVWTSFGLSLTIPGNNRNSPFYLEAKNGKLSPAPDSLPEAIIRAAQRGDDLVSQVAVERTFKADAGFGFDPTTIRYRTSSINPRKAPLPTQLCDEKRLQDCVSLSKDRTSMQLRFFLYPGVDGRRSWVDAEIDVVQVSR